MGFTVNVFTSSQGRKMARRPGYAKEGLTQMPTSLLPDLFLHFPVGKSELNIRAPCCNKGSPRSFIWKVSEDKIFVPQVSLGDHGYKVVGCMWDSYRNYEVLWNIRVLHLPAKVFRCLLIWFGFRDPWSLLFTPPHAGLFLRFLAEQLASPNPAWTSFS